MTERQAIEDTTMEDSIRARNLFISWMNIEFRERTFTLDCVK